MALASHTRALLAAAVHALVDGRKVAGLYDHHAGQHRRIAAEARGGHLQGYDADRDARFGGTLPELLDAADCTTVTMTVEGARAQGYDRGSSGFYTAEVAGRSVQLFDHAAGRWFAFDVQSA